MIGATEAKQLANAARQIRDKSSVLIERVDAAIKSAAEDDTLDTYFVVDTTDIEAAVIARVANLYRCNGWAVALGKSHNEAGR